MQPFHENLLTALDRAVSEEEVFQALLAAARQLGFEHCAYGLRLAVPISNPKVITLNNYPRSWQARYMEAGYLAIDPSVRHGQVNQSPILWDDALFASAETLWAEAKDQGLRHGWAQSSLDGFGVGGMLTLSRSSEVLTARELREKDSEMRWLVQAAHISLSRLMKPKYAPQPEIAADPARDRGPEVERRRQDGQRDRRHPLDLRADGELSHQERRAEDEGGQQDRGRRPGADLRIAALSAAADAPTAKDLMTDKLLRAFTFWIRTELRDECRVYLESTKLKELAQAPGCRRAAALPRPRRIGTGAAPPST